jgi:hypothetical protein
MKRQSETNLDRWAGRRKAFFDENKRLADKLARQRGGMCLSGPQRKSEKWLWKCNDPTHKPWKAKLFQVEGFGGRKGSWCPLCRTSSWAKRRNKRFAENKKLADKLAKEKLGRCLSGPRRKHDKWRWKCNNDDHKEWQATLCQIEGSGKKLGSWCPRCSGRNVPKKELQEWAKRFGGKLVKQASSTVKPSIWWCKHHDNFTRIYNNMKQTGTFCPDCSASFGERKCKAAMEQLFGVKFVKRRFSDMKGIGGKSLEIDLYNDELKLGLEHQGAQHFIRKKYFGEHKYDGVREHDRRKKAYCAKRGITLIEIHQVGEKTPDNKLKEAIREQLLKKNFPLPPNFEKINVLLDVAALPSLQEDKWEETKAEAARRGWRVVSKKYLGCLTIHHFICDQGHQVEIRPSYLIWGDGCRRCEQRPVAAEDGRLFDSMSEAAESLGTSVSNVSSGISKNGRVRGQRLAAIGHKQLNALRKMRSRDRMVAVAAIFAALPVRPRVGESNGKPVLLGDGRIFPSSYEAARAVGVSGNVAYAAATRTKGKINGIRIAQITNEQRDVFKQKPSLIDAFWRDRPLGPRKFMTRRRGMVTSLLEVFDGVREASEAMGVSEQQVCDYARREKELKGRRLWYLSQEELTLLRNKKVKTSDLLKKKKIQGHTPPMFATRKKDKT